MARLQAVQVRNLKKVGRHGDGDGLYLVVRKSGRKNWILRIQVDGKSTDRGLGSYPVVSLRNARAEAKRLRAEIAEGNDTSVPTFEDAIRDYHAEKTEEGYWKNPKSGRVWLQRAEHHLIPTLGHKPLTELHPKDIHDLLYPMRGREIGKRLGIICKTSLRKPVMLGFVQANVAEQACSVLSLRPQNRKQRACHYSQVAEVLGKIRDSDAYEVTKDAINFIALAAARSGEVRFATWDEIDLNKRTWSIPAERMKSRDPEHGPHIVPLSNQAVDILRRRMMANGEDQYIFPRIPSKPMSTDGMSKLMRELNTGTTIHGLRSCFKTWAVEQTNYGNDAIEISLSHVFFGGVESRYFRGEMLVQRRDLMQAWADYVV